MSENEYLVQFRMVAEQKATAEKVCVCFRMLCDELIFRESAANNHYAGFESSETRFNSLVAAARFIFEHHMKRATLALMWDDLTEFQKTGLQSPNKI